MFEQYEDVLDIEQVCDILKMSRNSVYALLKSKALKGYQEGRIWKIPKLAIILYIKKRSGLE